MSEKKFSLAMYAKETGLEITPGWKEARDGNGGLREGRIHVRFFLLQAPAQGKTTHIKFILEPFEAFDLSLKIQRVCSEGGKEKLVHKFRNPQGEEVVTSLQVEAWSRGEREGYGFSVGRGEDFISVPVSREGRSRFLHAAEVLRYLSTRQLWAEEG